MNGTDNQQWDGIAASTSAWTAASGTLPAGAKYLVYHGCASSRPGWRPTGVADPGRRWCRRTSAIRATGRRRTQRVRPRRRRADHRDRDDRVVRAGAKPSKLWLIYDLETARTGGSARTSAASRTGRRRDAVRHVLSRQGRCLPHRRVDVKPHRGPHDAAVVAIPAGARVGGGRLLERPLLPVDPVARAGERPDARLRRGARLVVAAHGRGSAVGDVGPGRRSRCCTAPKPDGRRRRQGVRAGRGAGQRRAVHRLLEVAVLHVRRRGAAQADPADPLRREGPHPGVGREGRSRRWRPSSPTSTSPNSRGPTA
jgi:hypothetical protein